MLILVYIFNYLLIEYQLSFIFDKISNALNWIFVFLAKMLPLLVICKTLKIVLIALEKYECVLKLRFSWFAYSLCTWSLRDAGRFGKFLELISSNFECSEKLMVPNRSQTNFIMSHLYSPLNILNDSCFINVVYTLF